MNRLIALAFVLVAGALIARIEERLPDPSPSTAPATTFSAGRAMMDVATMARAPHPIGSEANARVRDHLIDRMAQLGLSPQVHSGIGVQQQRRAPEIIVAGAVENIIGVLPGRDRAAPALALMAHYDSVPASPGAADDAAGVSSALETVRAIKARGTPARDVMLVLTDGEEAGLLGANAFFQRDPMAKRVGLVLNMEARGAGGRAQMFQTSPDNGRLIDLIARGGVRPASSSLTVFVYERMPNDTDLTESLKTATPGLNYAFIGRQFDYHSPSSTAAWLDQGSLQDLGQEVLGAASVAAFAPALPGKSPQAVYAATFEGVILAYPGWVGWIVLVLSAGLLVIGIRAGRRLAPYPWTDLARGAAGLLFATLGAAACLQFARHLTGAGFGFLEQRELLARVAVWEWAAALTGLGFLLMGPAALARGRRMVAFVPLVAGLACSAFGQFDPIGLGAGVGAAIFGLIALGRPVSRPGAWAGALLLGMVLAVAVQALAPPAAQVLAWPLALASLAAALTACAARPSNASLIVVALIATVGFAWIGGFWHGSFQSLDLMPLLGLPLLVAGLVIWPLAQPANGARLARWVGPLLLVLGFAVAGWLRFTDPYDVRHPQATYVVYHIDQDAGRAWRTSLTPDLPAWSHRVLTADGGAVAKHAVWVWRQPVDAAPAKMVDEPAPAITLTRQADGRLVLQAVPSAPAQALLLQITPTVGLSVVSVGGVPTNLNLKPGQRAKIYWQAGAGGVGLLLRPAGPGRVTVNYASRIDRWPEAVTPLPARPARVAPFDETDTTLLTGSRRFAW